MHWCALLVLAGAILAAGCGSDNTTSGTDGKSDPGFAAEAMALSDADPDPDADLVSDANPDTGFLPPGGPVDLHGVFNARETGGLIALNGLRVRRNTLIRSGDLSGLDELGCGQFAGLGIRSIVDLRAAAEAEATPDAACAKAQTTTFLAGIPRILPPTPDSYLQTLAAAEPSFPGIFARLGAPGGLPAILHCVIGRDRAGIALAVVLRSLGVPDADVLDDFTTNQEASVQADWLKAVLDRIEEAGGIDAYLAACGVDPVDIVTLRDNALESL